ncbi:sensor histidine kinase [Halobacteriovorax sp. RT-2-6]|uniref:sensor histidine kinase n=2 Tax=unclassified Halobacteriovorax TaxID=2639665 RepID=UPI00399B7A51
MYEFKCSKLMARLIIDSVTKLGVDKAPFNELYSKYENTCDKYISYKFLNDYADLLLQKVDEDEVIRVIANDGLNSEKLSVFKNLVFSILSLKSLYNIQSKLVLTYLFKGVTLNVSTRGKNIRLVQEASAPKVHSLFFKIYAEVYRNFPMIIGREPAKVVSLRIENSSMTMEISPSQKLNIVSTIGLFLKTRFAHLAAKSMYINLINELREESDQQNYELKKLNEQLDQSLKQKSVLVRALGHDINNSIVTIKLSCERLLRTLEDEKDLKVATTISKHIEIINLIANNALQNEIDEDHIVNNYSIENVSSVVDDLVDSFKDKILRKNLDVITEVSTQSSDFYINRPIFTYNILANYFYNAIKYSFPYGRIIISISEINDFFVFKIIDEGKGMNVSMSKQVLGTEGETGRGQGMIIARNLLAKMYGDVVVSSKQGVGTSVSISIPKSLSTTSNSNHFTL